MTKENDIILYYRQILKGLENTHKYVVSQLLCILIFLRQCYLIVFLFANEDATINYLMCLFIRGVLIWGDGSHILVVGKHVVKGVIQLIIGLLDLQLLTIDLVLQIVNPVVELGDVHLAILIPGLGQLEPLHNLVNL